MKKQPKKRIKSIVLGFLAAVILCTAVFAAPAITRKNIEVAYADYKIYIDGELFEPMDKNGVIESFNYNGWIWAPFEHIAKALGKTASWDGDTHSLYLGEAPKKIEPMVRTPVSFATEVPPYETSKHGVTVGESVTMAGTTYDDAISYAIDGKWTIYTTHNLGGKYKRISGYLGRIDGAGAYDVTFKFYSSGELIESYELKANEIPIPIVVDVTGVTQLKIEVYLPGSTKYAFVGTIE